MPLSSFENLRSGINDLGTGGWPLPKVQRAAGYRPTGDLAAATHIVFDGRLSPRSVSGFLILQFSFLGMLTGPAHLELVVSDDVWAFGLQVELWPNMIHSKRFFYLVYIHTQRI